MELIFLESHSKSYPKIQFLLILKKCFKSYDNINGFDHFLVWALVITRDSE